MARAEYRYRLSHVRVSMYDFRKTATSILSPIATAASIIFQDVHPYATRIATSVDPPPLIVVR